MKKISQPQKQKPFLIESDFGLEFLNKFFTDFLKENNIKRYSRFISLAVVFAERISRTLRDFYKRTNFLEQHGNWIYVLPVLTKQYKTRLISPTKQTPIKASLEKSEGYVYRSLLDNRRSMIPWFKFHNLVRFADLRDTFSKGDTTKWSNNFLKSQKILMIQYRVIAMALLANATVCKANNYQSLILKLHWKRQNWHWKRLIVLWKPRGFLDSSTSNEKLNVF